MTHSTATTYTAFRSRGHAIAFSVLALVVIALMIYIGPLDGLYHGYYFDPVPAESYYPWDNSRTIALSQDPLTVTFSPKQKNLEGFALYFTNQENQAYGTGSITVSDETGKVVDTIRFDLSRAFSNAWFYTYLNKNLQAGKTYQLSIQVENCATPPLLLADELPYLAKETISGNAVIGYAYAKPTFSFPQKVLMTLFSLSALILLFFRWTSTQRSSLLRSIALFVLLVSILSWNYLYSSMNTDNENFTIMSIDSEELVTKVIDGLHDGLWIMPPEDAAFGLGGYQAPALRWIEGLSVYNSPPFENGYSTEQAMVQMTYNAYTASVAIPGNFLRFSNGIALPIANIEIMGNDVQLFFDTQHQLNAAQYGDLLDASFMDAQGNTLTPCKRWAYKSQVGLQGWLFQLLFRFVPFEFTRDVFYLLCSLLTASVFVGIAFLLNQKYDFLFAAVWLVIFWLSPWTVNVARNLYWLEFTWFLPMLIGLYCSLHEEKKIARLFSYVAMFVAVLIKCLCGYEYLSTILMAAVAFPFFDFVGAWLKNNKEKRNRLFRILLVLTILCLLAFVTALLIHGAIRGSELGLMDGMKTILERDVLRRTVGGDYNSYDRSVWNSFDASTWETITGYFKTDKQIIAGVSGSLFQVLCLLPIAIFLYDWHHGQLSWEEVLQYFYFMLTTLSWIVLAKAHSQAHTFLNFVLWYTGYVQTCFLIPTRKIQRIIRRTQN